MDGLGEGSPEKKNNVLLTPMTHNYCVEISSRKDRIVHVVHCSSV